MNNFQTILTAVFIAIFVFAVLVFSGMLNIGQKDKATTGLTGNIIVWGTLDSKNMDSLLPEVDPSKESELSIKYIQKNVDTYQEELIEAFALGTAPDLFIIDPSMIIRNDKFVYKTSYDSFPEKIFRDTYIDGADIYLGADGIYAFPFLVDPMVMYYNKNLLSNEGIATPPSYWDEFFILNSKLTKKNTNGGIDKSMIALGGYDNINNAKEILSTLFIQSNSPIITRDGAGYEVYLDSSDDSTLSPFKALEFYMSFSKNSNEAYSWNKSLPKSLDMFTSGKLAFYLGYASELFKIQEINTNLSFDIAKIPQLRNIENKRNYGKIYAIAINKKSGNLSTAVSVASKLGTADVAKSLSINFSLPTASRSLLTEKPKQTYLYSFWDSAIISRSWIDPDKKKSDKIFENMIDGVLLGGDTTSGALRNAGDQLNLLLK
ncbi:TPA: hypothetical protein DIC38_02135 [Candidatus Nomurabacteria bacterium]|nr:MAG: hypothetical protein O210_OD1C00001G0303 [Parcubacteria bacterium RAAC4_OD1_1]HCY26456.1 hypothetical protein [Candidatus Nomurabacteria bacterium]